MVDVVSSCDVRHCPLYDTDEAGKTSYLGGLAVTSDDERKILLNEASTANELRHDLLHEILHIYAKERNLPLSERDVAIWTERIYTELYGEPPIKGFRGRKPNGEQT